MNASEAGHAYRLGLMGPQARAEYEDAVKLGIVKDNYASTRLQLRNSPDAVRKTAQTMQSLASSVPGVSELQAATNAGVMTGVDALRGNGADFGSRWKQQRDNQQAILDEYRTAHPTSAAATQGIGYAGQAAAALASGGGTAAPQVEAAAAPGIRALASRLAMAGAKNGLIGGGYGAANAAAQPGSLSERIQAADRAIGPSAAFGVAIPAAFAGGKGLVQAGNYVAKRAGAVGSEMFDAAGRAISGKLPYDQAAPIPPEIAAQGQTTALDYLRQLGATPASLRQAVLDAHGKPIVTAETLGPNGVSQATGIARRAGTAPAVADATLRARAADRAQRVLADITDHTGVDPSAARGHIDALVEHGKAMANPLFDAVRATPGPIMTPELAAWAQTGVGKKTIASVVESIRNVPGGNPLEHGLPIDPDTGAVGSGTPGLNQMELQPTAHAWDAIRGRMSQMVERDQFGRPIPDSKSPGNYDLNQSRRYLTTALAGDGTEANPGALPGYRAALDMSGDEQGIDRAFQNAKGKLFGKAANADPADFARWHAGLRPIEQEAAKASAANDILTGLDNGTLRPGTFALPHVQKKLTTLFGPDATAKLTASMDQEARMAANEARMRPNMNSVTGDVIGSGADQADMTGQAALDATGHLLMGKPGKAARSLAGTLAPYMSAARKPLDMAGRNALGDLLYADPADVAHLLEAHGAAPVDRVSMPRLSGPMMRQFAIQYGADQPQ